MYLVHVLADQIVPDAVPPLDHVAWVDAECKPVPGLSGDLLPQDHQQVVTCELGPVSVRVGGVVLGGGSEVQPARAASGRRLPGR